MSIRLPNLKWTAAGIAVTIAAAWTTSPELFAVGAVATMAYVVSCVTPDVL